MPAGTTMIFLQGDPWGIQGESYAGSINAGKRLPLNSLGCMAVLWQLKQPMKKKKECPKARASVVQEIEAIDEKHADRISQKTLGVSVLSFARQLEEGASVGSEGCVESTDASALRGLDEMVETSFVEEAQR